MPEQPAAPTDHVVSQVSYRGDLALRLRERSHPTLPPMLDLGHYNPHTGTHQTTPFPHVPRVLKTLRSALQRYEDQWEPRPAERVLSRIEIGEGLWLRLRLRTDPEAPSAWLEVAHYSQDHGIHQATHLPNDPRLLLTLIEEHPSAVSSDVWGSGMNRKGCSHCGRTLFFSDSTVTFSVYCPDLPCRYYPNVPSSWMDDPSLPGYLWALVEGHKELTAIAVAQALGKNRTWGHGAMDRQRKRWEDFT